METRKDVQMIFEAFSIVGNFFNIILTIFKVINIYYANKILFVDIFKTIFFNKENIKINNIKKNINLYNCLNINKNNSLNDKKNLDFSEQIYFNNNINQNNSINHRNVRIIPKNVKNIIKKNYSKRQIKSKKIVTENNLFYYYLLPLWFLKRNKNFKNF